MNYIYEHSKWPGLYWDQKKLAIFLCEIKKRQGFLLGKISSFGFDLKNKGNLDVLAENIVKSSQIEGEYLDQQQVRSSIAKKLGIEIAGIKHQPVSRHIDGVVEMMLDATQKYNQPLTKERLFSWHSALFPLLRSGMTKITVGEWRTVESGPMQVVSGAMGREKVHYEAPCASKLDHEIDIFLDWFNNSKGIDPVIKAGVAHFWFVTIHPFEDGNGRIARAIADMCLSRADEMPERFYSMSSQIKDERAQYYLMLEESQGCNLDITKWLEWFVACFDRSIKNADQILNKIIIKANLWRKLDSYSSSINININERQKKIINILTDNFEGKLTSSKYAKINKCSQDTAIRDIKILIEYGVISQSEKSGRSTSYSLNDF